MTEALLELEQVEVVYDRVIRAVQGISLRVPAAATVATHPLISPARCSSSTRLERRDGRRALFCGKKPCSGTAS